MDDFIYDIRWDQDETEWRACARRELVMAWLEQYRSKQGRESVLDLGCGTGMLVQQLQALGEVYGVDLSPKAVEYSRQRGLRLTVVGSAEEVCFADNAFDIVTMVEVLEHLEDDVRALADIRRLIRPGGLLLITVPAFKLLWSSRDVHLHHKRRYTTGELTEKLVQAGFRPLYCSYIDLFLFLPLLLLVKLSRLRGQSKRFEMYEVSAPTVINEFLLRVCRLERRIYSRTKLPFGVSIACVAERMP